LNVRLIFIEYGMRDRESCQSCWWLCSRDYEREMRLLAIDAYRGPVKAHAVRKSKEFKLLIAVSTPDMQIADIGDDGAIPVFVDPTDISLNGEVLMSARLSHSSSNFPRPIIRARVLRAS
jgi:hypothetical protein